MSDGNEFHVRSAATERAQRASGNSCLHQIAKVRRRLGRHCLKRHGCRLVDDPLSDRQPVECSEQRSGVGSAFTLANDPGQVVLRSLQDVESRRRRAEQQSVAVVQSGGNDTACHCLRQVVAQQTAHVTHVACVVV